MTTFSPRPHIVDAKQWDGDAECAFALGAWQTALVAEPRMFFAFDGPRMKIVTPRDEGMDVIAFLDPGDWVICIEGNFFAVKDGAFKKMYEAL